MNIEDMNKIGQRILALSNELHCSFDYLKYVVLLSIKDQEAVEQILNSEKSDEEMMNDVVAWAESHKEIIKNKIISLEIMTMRGILGKENN